MSALDFDAVHRDVTETADLVQRLADLVRQIADTVGNSGAGSAGLLSATMDSLADQARTAANAIDRCLPLAADRDAEEAMALGCAFAKAWTMTLGRTLDLGGRDLPASLQRACRPRHLYGNRSHKS